MPYRLRLTPMYGCMRLTPVARIDDAATATQSFKGQVVIHKEIRACLGLKTGAQFVVVGDRDVVILKVLDPPTPSEFAAVTATARRANTKAGITRANVTTAVANVRRGK